MKQKTTDLSSEEIDHLLSFILSKPKYLDQQMNVLQHESVQALEGGA